MATESDLFLGIFEDYLKDVGRMKDKSRASKLVAEFELLFWRGTLLKVNLFSVLLVLGWVADALLKPVSI